MKQKLVIIFAFLFQFAFSQKDTIEIKGKISDPTDKNKTVFCFKVKFTSDSLTLETECDTNGYYRFKIAKKFINKATVYAYQDFNLINQRYPKPADCPYVYTGPKRYMNSGFCVFTSVSSARVYVADMELRDGCFMPVIPCFSFKKNTTETIKCDEFDADTAIICLKYFLVSNPTIVIDIAGSSYNEKKGKDLSYQRALKLKNKLTALGIDSIRIKAVGNGDANAFYSKKQIRAAGSKKEKETLKTKNRYAYFRIISWDYDPKLRKIVERAAVTTDDED